MHPIDQNVRQYQTLLDERENIDRNLKSLAALQARKVVVDAALEELRLKMTAPEAPPPEPPAPAITSN